MDGVFIIGLVVERETSWFELRLNDFRLDKLLRLGERNWLEAVVRIFTSIGFIIAQGWSPKYGQVHLGGSSSDVVSFSFLRLHCCFLFFLDWFNSLQNSSPKARCSRCSEVCMLLERRLERGIVDNEDAVVVLKTFNEARRFPFLTVSCGDFSSSLHLLSLLTFLDKLREKRNWRENGKFITTSLLSNSGENIYIFLHIWAINITWLSIFVRANIKNNRIWGERMSEEGTWVTKHQHESHKQQASLWMEK